MSVHRDIFGPKGMLAVAPRFFKNKDLRKSALRSPSPKIFGNCLREGRSNVVDSAEWPKIGLLNRGLGAFCWLSS